MSDLLTLSPLASRLLPLVTVALKAGSRLRAERRAGREHVSSLLMERNLDRTLDRLRGGNIDDSWWRNVLDRVGHEYVTPDFLKAPALQDWLARARVAEDLKALASAVIMGGDAGDPETRGRLAGTYSDLTGEASQLAEGPIDVTVGILIAGYIASIPTDQLPVAGMIQGLSNQLHDFSGSLQERLDRSADAPLAELTDSITRKAHTAQAEQELARILSLRVFDPSRARRKSRELCERVSNGDLIATDKKAKNNVRYWAARLCAGDAEAIDFARQLREELGQGDPDRDVSIVDALLAESDGDNDKALRLLRDAEEPDSRTVLFSLLAQSRGEPEALRWHAEQAATDDGNFFTAVGWKNWALCMAKVGRWEDAASRLRDLESLWQGMPALAFVEGVINAALLLPDEYREMALNAPPLYKGIRPTVGLQAKKHHSRAVACFEFVAGHLEDIDDHDLARFVSEWRLWLRLMDPHTEIANRAREDICQRLDQGARGVGAVPFAYAFDIPHDGRQLWTYLESRNRLGGLKDDELLAECLLAQQSMSARDLVKYLERHEGRLANVMPVPFTTAIHVDALVRDGQTGRARELVMGRAADLGEAFSKALILEIEAHEGHDPRGELEELYDRTGSTSSLLGLVAHLKMLDDRAALLPLVRELFRRQRNIENAHDIIRCLSDPFSVDHASIVEFLDENSDLLAQSDHLKAAKAWALYHVGRLKDSKSLNDDLLNKGIDEEALHLDINIAVSSGDWERLPVIVEREWPRRDSHGPETLMTLAQLTAQQTLNPERALQLVRLAASKAPDDPRILAAAYWLHFHLGRDDEADPGWLARASELSTPDKGPLWRADVREVVTEWFPRQQKHLRDVERRLLDGEIPISLAASGFNLPLARLLLSFPDQNANNSDRRGQAISPVVAGSRQPIHLQEDWTIGLDVTSVMVLSYLDLLEKAIETFRHTKIAPETMECLFRERDEARFHQPSRIEAAKRIREIQNQGRLKAASSLSAPPDTIAAEVGIELATLLNAARHDNGSAICVLPITKAGSLTADTANTSQYDDLIHSTMDLCALLHDGGRIAATDFQRARSFFNSQGQAERPDVSPAILNGPLYLDRLALHYLQDAHLLRPVVAAGLDLRVHPAVFDEMNAYIEAGDTGENLASRIERIRQTLQKAVDSGKVSFLPRHPSPDEWPESSEFRFHATASLLAGGTACDALCVDDRYINGISALALSAEESVPIICVLDVLRHLMSRGDISVVDHWTARHRLRQGGFAFIPLESDELLHWLKEANFSNNQLTESAELRVLRQAVARADSLDLATRTEALALTGNVTATCRQVIRDLWEDTNLKTDHAARLSDWVWHNIAAMMGPAGRRFLGDGYRNWVKRVLSLRLVCLLLPMTVQSSDRRAEYSRWLEQAALRRLQPANLDAIDTALFSVPETISTLDDDQDLCGFLFLDQLPEQTRRKVTTRNPEFAHRCGVTLRRTFELGVAGVVAGELFAIAKDVLATKEKKTLQDIKGTDVLVDLDKEGKNVVVKWSDAQAVSHEVQIPNLTLLSSSGEARVAALRDIVERLGPTASDFRPLLQVIESREITHEELTEIFDESANGVVALQARAVEKVRSGSGFTPSDTAPPSLSYFEGFAGPCAVNWEPEAYFRDVLVPYRRGLLDRNLSAGLDICCLGAMRDDLMPGSWVGSADDDAIWEALSSCWVKDNPFSLLAALDLVLYRQGDRRFRDFAADAVAALSAENLGKHDGPDMYMLLHVLAELMLNRINLVEGGAKYPGYWKRMSAWMQAGLIARALISSPSPIDIAGLQKWTRENMVVAGVYAGLVDLRAEPMVFASWITPWALRSEIVDRLNILRLRHERQGRRVPRSEEIDRVLARPADSGHTVLLGFPGLLEGHRRPVEPLPQNVSESLEEAWVGSGKAFAMQQLVTVSQRYALDEPTLRRAREMVKTIRENAGVIDRQGHLKCLELASVVSAATRDTGLADGIADAVIAIVPGVSRAEEIATVLQITLQAAAAYETQEAWVNWLDERLAGIATNLPAPPNESLRFFLGQLRELGTIVPIESWCHIRARTVALAGAA